MLQIFIAVFVFLMMHVCCGYLTFKGLNFEIAATLFAVVVKGLEKKRDVGAPFPVPKFRVIGDALL